MIIESKIAVNCHHFIPFQTGNKNKFIFGKFHCFFSRKILRWCLTFDAVYTKYVARLIFSFMLLMQIQNAFIRNNEHSKDPLHAIFGAPLYKNQIYAYEIKQKGRSATLMHGLTRALIVKVAYKITKLCQACSKLLEPYSLVCF